MNLTETRNMNLLEKYLDMTATRQSLIANNIANIDTPGFHARDIDFSSELRRAVSSETPNSVRAHDVSGLIERPDGNNVSLDRESMSLAQTQLQFRVGVELLKREFHRMVTAINEGRES